MKPFEKRMIEEYQDLIKRIEKLENFLLSDKIINISKKQHRLMRTQYFAMCAYMEALRMRIEDLKLNFSSPQQLSSTEETHWVNHIHDEYVNASQKSVGCYCNLHGFEESGGIYWVGIDMRFIGIRVQDVLIKCKNKSTYDYWINRVGRKGPDGVIKEVRNDSNLICHDGEDVNTEFIFRWGDDEKNFDIHVWGDIYAEEK